MPPPWKAAIQAATSKQPHQDLADFLRTAPLVPGVWYRLANRAGLASTNPAALHLAYRINPLGILTVGNDNLSVDPRRVTLTQIHVWTHRRLAHSQAQREARERALERGEPDPLPPTLLMSGAVAGPIPGLPSPAYAAGANPSHFSLTYTTTDRLRQPTPMHRADVNHIYLSQLSAFYAPVRTLNPDHVATTSTSTSWVPLLDHPTATPQKIRLALTQAPMKACLPPHLQETQLLVRSDGLHVGDRCVKKGCRKGICDLCYILLGTRVPETTRHIVLDCPFTRPVIMAVWREAYMAHTQPQTYTQTQNTSADNFCSSLERRIVFGVPTWDPPRLKTLKSQDTAIATISAATNAALIRRRNNNALNTKCPLQTDVSTIVRSIFSTVCQTATVMRTTAQRTETMIYTHYEGWLPEDEKLPTTEWAHDWCVNGIMQDVEPSATLQFDLANITIPDNPQFDTNDPAVATRVQQRLQTPLSY